MRIAVCIELFDPMAGGNERSTDQLMRELVKRGHHVTLVTGRCKKDHRPEGIETHAYAVKKSSGPWRLWRYRNYALSKLREGNFDTSLSVTMAVPARVMQPRGGTVKETLERNIAMRKPGWPQLKKRLELLTNPKRQLLLHYEKKTLQDPTVYRVAALSDYVVRQLDEHYDFPAERTVIIPNAAVMPEADAQQQQQWRASIRSAFGVPEDAIAYVFIAQNPDLKGFETLIGALQKTRQQGIPAVALLAGNYGYGHLKTIAAAGLRDHVRMVAQTRSAAMLYAAADVTVLPSFYDPSSKVILESLMMGTPAISTTYNGASDHLTPPDGSPRGLVIDDPADPRKLADVMIRLADADFRGACAEACTGLADQLSMKRHVDQLEQVLYESVPR